MNKCCIIIITRREESTQKVDVRRGRDASRKSTAGLRKPRRLWPCAVLNVRDTTKPWRLRPLTAIVTREQLEPRVSQHRYHSMPDCRRPRGNSRGPVVDLNKLHVKLGEGKRSMKLAYRHHAVELAVWKSQGGTYPNILMLLGGVDGCAKVVL